MLDPYHSRQCGFDWDAFPYHGAPAGPDPALVCRKQGTQQIFQQLEECDDICWLTCWGVFELPDTDKYLVPLRGSPNVFPDPFGSENVFCDLCVVYV